jgi:hypothetical protein
MRINKGNNSWRTLHQQHLYYLYQHYQFDHKFELLFYFDIHSVHSNLKVVESVHVEAIPHSLASVLEFFANTI